MYGIDVSNNNSPASVDWDGVQFCFIKSTESTTFVDRVAPTFAAECDRRSIPYGFYHFAHPDQRSAAAEAQFFLSHVASGHAEIAPALDIETRTGYNPLLIMGPVRLAAWIDEWCGIVKDNLGVAPFLYTFRSYASQLLPLVNPAWPLWLATAAGKPSYQAFAGRVVAIEQYSNVGGMDRNEAYVPITTTPPPSGDDDMTPEEFHDQILGGDPQVDGTATWADVIKATIRGVQGLTVAVARLEAKVDALAAGGSSGSGSTTTPTHLVGTVDLHAAP